MSVGGRRENAGSGAGTTAAEDVRAEANPAVRLAMVVRKSG